MHADRMNCVGKIIGVMNQLEFVGAPPVEEMPLQDDGVHGGIHEFSFR
jgi:hypothetical protein